VFHVGMGEPLSRGGTSPDLLTASRTALALPTPSEYR